MSTHEEKPAKKNGTTMKKMVQVESNDLNMMDVPDEDEINNNPFVLSKTEPVGPYSFVDDR